MTTLLAFCGYCTYVLGICGITSLRQVLTRENIRSFAAWLHDVRGCRWYTVYSVLDRLYHLTQLGHPLFAGSDEEYAWFRTLLKRLSPRVKDKLRVRKIARSVPYKAFTQIAREIGKVLQANKHLNPIQREATSRLLFLQGDRASSLAKTQLERMSHRSEIPPKPRVQNHTVACPAKRRAAPLGQASSEGRFGTGVLDVPLRRTRNQSKKEIWEPLDPKIVKIFLEYLDVHRGIILGGCSDPGTLLINNAGKPMTNSQLTAPLGYLAASTLESG
jgi:hypothetical protein